MPSWANDISKLELRTRPSTTRRTMCNNILLLSWGITASFTPSRRNSLLNFCEFPRISTTLSSQRPRRQFDDRRLGTPCRTAQNGRWRTSGFSGSVYDFDISCQFSVVTVPVRPNSIESMADCTCNGIPLSHPCHLTVSLALTPELLIESPSRLTAYKDWEVDKRTCISTSAIPSPLSICFSVPGMGWYCRCRHSWPSPVYHLPECPRALLPARTNFACDSSPGWALGPRRSVSVPSAVPAAILSPCLRLEAHRRSIRSSFDNVVDAEGS